MQSATLLSVEIVAEDHLELTLLHPEAAAQTKAGQFIKLSVGAHDAAFLAIASAPGAPQMRFLVQVGSPLTQDLARLQVGDSVQVSTPMGKGFDLSGLENRTPLFFATGSGISALRSVLESRDWSGTGARLYYGARTLARMPYQAQFSAWEARGVQVIPVLSREDGDWDGARGHIQEVYAQDPVDGANAALVLCGVKGMCTAATDLLVAQGMPKTLALLNF
ncbi:MAG: sulfhydrogenase subunit gamma (sulfur reductase) [Cognaticolwellia sp.]|jgi:sulfhydrogenase subunit gamma (sulfur reductase)